MEIESKSVSHELSWPNLCIKMWTQSLHIEEKDERKKEARVWKRNVNNKMVLSHYIYICNPLSTGPLLLRIEAEEGKLEIVHVSHKCSDLSSSACTLI